MTFWNYFAEISNIPVIIVALCILIGIFHSSRRRIKIIFHILLKTIFYPFYFLFALLFSLAIRKSRDKGL